ncbi:succinate dehydrogenase, hydrophobic membrane anchor protein [Rhodovibrio sodomensis]|uniref:Succinate dehydrogenase hydrophobic membrane anchor subunit n=1 Tax=Rhodovibrio sodomensis TaxID=1088 RepID=A0ABS1DII6_9PROT|nr:succinate dehydrogenase, hydrophobic membrane anchor protein [Rhodovibrio sodomensis]MBK1670291.1 succinate dehydrogenase, hydrophobic membrane anchor protein [Rhodovibrio sodomensis]
MRTMRTPMARVRGLGAARDGTGHWWMQKLLSLALIPLTIWFVASVIALAGADHAAVTGWLGNPVAAGLMILLVIATFYHGLLGVQAVVEDYVHNEAAKFALLIGLKGLHIVLGLTGVLAVLTILFQG